MSTDVGRNRKVCSKRTAAKNGSCRAAQTESLSSPAGKRRGPRRAAPPAAAASAPIVFHRCSPSSCCHPTLATPRWSPAESWYSAATTRISTLASVPAMDSATATAVRHCVCVRVGECLGNECVRESVNACLLSSYSSRRVLVTPNESCARVGGCVKTNTARYVGNSVCALSGYSRARMCRV